MRRGIIIKMTHKIMFSSGEVSGDMHAAYLAEEIKKIDSQLYLFGMGSERLRACGVDIRCDISKQATIGLLEALPNIANLYSAFLKMKGLLTNEKPDLLILIDSQGFNVPLAKFAKSLGIKTIYYIPPQEWLWGTERNAKKIAETLDLIIAIFYKEYSLYKKLGASVEYFGHPLLDIVRPSLDKNIFCKKYDLSLNSPIISLCPGSRIHEIKNFMPPLLKAAKLLKNKVPDIQFVLPISIKWLNPLIHKAFRRHHFYCTLIQDNKYNALAHSDIVLAASGTINLEACILGIPNLMFYKLSPLSYWIGKNILKIGKKMHFFSMPNLLADEMIVPEIIQNDLTPANLYNKARYLLDNKEKIKASFNKVISKLGPSGAIHKSAQAILSFL